ncbi:MAG: hypothetical protein ACYC8T_35075 [Myxococcaceae bacterium]
MVCLLPLPLLALSLGAAANNPWLESAMRSYAQLDCDRVLADLELARQVPTNDLATQLAIQDYAGRCHIALGHRADAAAAFARMLELDPQAELDPTLSPKIRDAFLATKLRLYPAGYVALKKLPASEGLLRAELVDPWKRVGSVVLGRFSPPTQRFDEERLAPAGSVYLARLATGASWFVEARGPGGEALALLGRKDPPVLAVIAPAPLVVEKAPRSTARWAAVGTGAVAVVTGVVLWGVAGGTRAAAEKPGGWADDAVALDDRATTQRNWGTGLFLGGAAVAAAGVVFTW